MTYVKSILILLCMISLYRCYSPNGPPPESYDAIDTVNIQFLDPPRDIKFEIVAEEWIESEYRHEYIESVRVVFNDSVELYTDSSGYCSFYATIYSMPHKFCYDLRKDGFIPWSACSWTNDTDLVHRGITLKRL